MSIHPPLTAEFVNKDGKRTTVNRLRWWLLGAAVILTGGGLWAAPDSPAIPTLLPTAATTSRSRPEQPATSTLRNWNLRQTPVVEVVKRVRDAVVNIHSERTVRATGLDEMFSNTSSQSRVNGMGTGILIDPRGYITVSYTHLTLPTILRV